MQLVALARNPIPSGAHVGHFAAHDGLHLRFARWDATRGPRRGTACIFQGRSEHIEKYFEVIADLRRRGYAVAIFDWRGQGGSDRMLADRRKGHVVSFTEYDNDLTRFMKDVVLPDCPPPYIALGHSMGGNILLRHSTIQGSWFERMILTAPMLGFADDKVPVPQSVARLYATLFGWGPLGERYVLFGSDRPEEARTFEGNALTGDPERFLRNKQILEAAPEFAIGSPTIAWLRAAYRANQALQRPDFALRVRVPCLLVAAGRESIVSSSAIEELARRLKIGARVVISGAQHEILQERDEMRLRFWAAFDSYMGLNAEAA